MSIKDLSVTYDDNVQYKKEDRHYHTDDTAAYMLPDDEIGM